MADNLALPEGTVTVVFTDVEGSTALRSAVGDDRGHEILSEHDDLVRKTLLEHSGTEVKALGDGFLLVFTSTRRAVEFGVGLQAAVERARLGPADRPLRVRIGMHTGEVVARDGDLFGQAVHAAARIQALATGGQTLVSAVVKALAGTLEGVTWDDAGDHELKGFDEPWQLYAVAGVPEEPGDGRVPLVARGAEYQRLLTALGAARDGTGAAVLIQGPAGVGKSRLAEELASQAVDRGFRVLRARCSERGVAAPFAPWVDLLRAGIEDTDAETLHAALGDAGAEIARVLPELRNMFPDIPEPQRLPADQERRYILESVAGFIARGAATRPLLLVVDDIHWADEASIALIDEMAPHVRHFPILFVATARPPDQPLAGVIARAVTERSLSLIDLDPLDESGVAALLEALTGQPAPATVVGQIATKTGGNPFYVTELVLHLQEVGIGFDEGGTWLPDPDLSGASVPDSIRLVLQARLDRVDADVRQVLAAAASIGRSAELKVAGRVADVAPAELVDALDVAEKAGLVVTEVDGAGRTLVTFVHDLIRDAVLEELTVVRTQQLHLRAAEAIRDLYGMHPQSAASIAEHLVAAGAMADEIETCDACLAAGEAAIEATAHVDALALFRRAYELAPAGTLQQALALRGLGTALRSTEGWESSLPRLMEALDAFVALGEAHAVSQLTTEIVLELAWAFRLQESFEVVERGMHALSELDAADDDAWLLLAASRASLLTLLGVFDQAHDAMDEVVARIEAMDRPPPPAVTLPQLQTALMMGHLSWQVAMYEDRIDGVRRSSDRWIVGELLGWAGFGLLQMGRIEDLRALTSELFPLAQGLGHANALVLAHRELAQLAILDGDLDKARDHIAEDERICLEQGFPWTVQAWGFQSHHALLAGDWDTADRLARKALAAEVLGAFRGATVAYAAYVSSHLGDAGNVRRLFDEHLEPTLDQELVWVGKGAMVNLMTMALAWVGETASVRRLRPSLALIEGNGGTVSAWVPVPQALLSAIAAAADEDWEQAHEDMARARAVAADVGMQPAFSELDRWDAWIHLQEGGDALAAVPNLIDHAERDYRAAGMDRHVGLVDQLRARLPEVT